MKGKEYEKELLKLHAYHQPPNPEVVVGARISKSGNATPQRGELEGASAPVKVGASGVSVLSSQRISRASQRVASPAWISSG